MNRFDPNELARWCDGAWDVPDSGPVITGFSKDTRDLADGNMYVAIRGESLDGHDFVGEAAARGASCALVSGTYAGGARLPLLRVEDTVVALQAIASGYRAAVDPFVVGVTGSSGKTTEKEMIAACLKETFRTAATLGNWNNHIGLPMSLLAMSADTECAVMEVGMNHPGELAPLCKILRPDWAVVTNVGPVHLEHFESIESIAVEKAELLRNTDSNGLAFLDADSRFFELLSSHARCGIVTVSASSGADYTYSTTDSNTAQVTEAETGESCEIELSVPGLHIAYDAVLAAAVARRKGIDWESISTALKGYRPLAMRWEVTTAGSVTVVNDAYNANPMSMRASIDAFMSEPCSGARWLVLGDMLELGDVAEDEHRRLGKWLTAQGALSLIGVGDQARYLVEGAGAVEGTAVLAADAAGAFEVLKEKVKPGDALLVKGSRGLKLEAVADELIGYLNSNH